MASIRSIKFDKSTATTASSRSINKANSAKFKKHRKSSIPFADRIPHVRFIKATEEHSLLDIAAFLPPPKLSDAGKPILKKTSHPILVDSGHPKASPSSEDRTNINWQIGDSTTYLERVSQHFSSIERETRGSLDILTYPVSSSAPLEALARFHCAFAVTILCIEDLIVVTAKSDRLHAIGEYISKIQKSGSGLLTHLREFKTGAKALQKSVKTRYKQWSKGVLVRGQFYLEPRRVSIIPVYGKGMPENVTLFENEVEPVDVARMSTVTLRPEGKIQFLRSGPEISVAAETRHEVISRTQEQLTETEVYCLISCLLAHCHELVAAAGARLKKTEELTQDPVFTEDYFTLRERLKRIDKDEGLDPLVALDLKGTLGEVLNRSEELLNTVGHVVGAADKMRSLVQMFLKYTATASVHKEEARCGCGGGCGRIDAEKVLETMGVAGMDFMISMPIREAFIKDFCHICADGDSVPGDK